MAEAADLKSAQCRFESDRGYTDKEGRGTRCLDVVTVAGQAEDLTGTCRAPATLATASQTVSQQG
jgi:hypothetical protein